ncbi:MAG: site-specific integrase, partial [Actinomycetota bacterium]
EEWQANIRVKRSPRSKGIAVRTFEQYESISRIHIVPALGNIKARDLTRPRVDRWLRDLEGSTYLRDNGTTVAYSANTLRLCRVVLGMALQWAISEGIVSRNVARESKPPGGRPRPEKHALSEEQARRLIQATRGSELGPLWALMITTGLRRGEALGLRWKDYDGESITVTSQIKLEAGEVVRGDLKTDKSKRRLRLPEFVIRDLEAHRERQLKQVAQRGKPQTDLMFTTSDGGYIRPDNLRKRFIAACHLAGIEPHEDGRPWGIHELRHTAASQLLNDRIPMQIVSRTLGHSSIYVTLDVYSHLTDQDSELIANSMNDRYDELVQK